MSRYVVLALISAVAMASSGIIARSRCQPVAGVVVWLAGAVVLQRLFTAKPPLVAGAFTVTAYLLPADYWCLLRAAVFS